LSVGEADASLGSCPVARYLIVFASACGSVSLSKIAMSLLRAASTITDLDTEFAVSGMIDTRYTSRPSTKTGRGSTTRNEPRPLTP
jgi:hypothetical protein